MGAQGKAPSPPTNSSQRVKVYHLNDEGKWDDRGTGHVTVGYVERSEDLGLFVIDEEDNETLLAHRIGSEENYRRQEDTIISWRDPEYSTELALSFQEVAGCSYIWDHICSARKNLHFSTLNDEVGPRSVTETLETSGMSHANDESFNSVSSELRELPAIELSTLPAILKIVVESSITDQSRITELLLHNQDFFPKLMDLFRICEDLEDINGLHLIFKLVKGIILLNSPQIFEKIFSDEYIMDIIGALEYDQETSRGQHHRAFLKEHVVFKEAIPIKDPLVLSKIHQTYRIGYIKDVILPRILEEGTIANLNSIIHANNAVVVSSLKDDNTFIQELFAKMRSSTTSAESKKNLVFFLHEFCSLSKSLPVVHQLRLFRDLMNEGIFDVISDALRAEDKRLVLTGTDILILFLSQDPNLLRTYVVRQEGSLLLGLLVKGMLTDFGEDMHCQFLEILRSLLDSYASGSQRDTIIEIFYEKHLDHLIDVITLSCPPKGIAQTVGKSAASSGLENQAITKPEILSNICELLCFCVLHHPYRIKCNFLLNNVIGRVLFLVNRKEKYLVVAAVRFMRIIISRNSLQDDQLLSHIVKKNLLKAIVEVFVDNGDRYNLLNSAVLDLFEYIRKENLKTLIIYIVDSFWSQLVKFEHLATIQALKTKYDQLQENCDIRNHINVVNPRKRNDERALEKEEEDYFNEDSDEEDTASAQSSHNIDQQAPTALPNGGTFSYASSLRPISGALVDYDDDDDQEQAPPSRSKLETSVTDERNTDPLTLKRKSTSDEGLELTKKQKLDRDSTDSDEDVSAAAPQTTCVREASPPCKDVVSDSASQDDKRSDEETPSEEEPAAPKSDSNCLPDTTDTKQPSEEGCAVKPPNSNNSTSEVVVNGGNVSGSEPYSVR